MKNLVVLFLAGIVWGLCSCERDTRSENSKAVKADPFNQRYAVNSAALQKDFDTWWKYTYYNINLSQDFVGLNVDSTLMKKADFLYRLTSGSVVPFKVMVRDSVTYYKLFPINESQAEIKSTIRQKAAVEAEHFGMEGHALPEYKFTDIKGNVYSPLSTKGKVVVLKCWYIGCIACVEEFPEANNLVDSYKDRDDVLFISLAMDEKEQLVDFLKMKPLKYATVPHMKEFMMQQLNINAYPTHIVLGKDGKIVKVVNRIEELKPFLDKQLD